MVLITTQPTTNNLFAAYRPIEFQVLANQSPLGIPATIPPVVYADVYFNNIFYKTICKTQALVIWGSNNAGTFIFDIQEVCQEYLNSQPNTSLNSTFLFNFNNSYQTTCFVRFRYAYQDANGITEQEPTVPIQATQFVSSTPGSGVQSNTFIVYNATLQHLHNQDLLIHLAKNNLANGINSTFWLRLTHQPLTKCICKNDVDFLPLLAYFLTSSNITTVVSGTYTNGIPFTDTINSTIASPPISTWDVASGPKNLSAIFTAINWQIVKNYTIEISNGGFLVAKQNYEVSCCNEYRQRIHFLNYLGPFDGVSFCENLEFYNTNSKRWEKPLEHPLNVSDTGFNRFNVRAVTKWRCSVFCYGEKAKEWIKEIYDSPVAFIEYESIELAPLGTATTIEYVPINILDAQTIPMVKEKERYCYEWTVEFEFANEVIRQRN